jgi:hypothetical protein
MCFTALERQQQARLQEAHHAAASASVSAAPACAAAVASASGHGWQKVKVQGRTNSYEHLRQYNLL